MLNKTRNKGFELKGEDIQDDARATVNLGIDLRIDETYVPDMNQRLMIYRRMANALVFHNCQLVFPDFFATGSLRVSDGRIASVQIGGNLNDPQAEVVDCAGDFLGPGFVDIHNHGAAGTDFIDGEVEGLAAALACTKSQPSRRTTPKMKKLPVPGPKMPSYRPMTAPSAAARKPSSRGPRCGAWC